MPTTAAYPVPAHDSSKLCACLCPARIVYTCTQMERTHQQVLGFQLPAFPRLLRLINATQTKSPVQLLLVLGSAQQHPLVVQRKIVSALSKHTATTTTHTADSHTVTVRTQLPDKHTRSSRGHGWSTHNILLIHAGSPCQRCAHALRHTPYKHDTKGIHVGD